MIKTIVLFDFNPGSQHRNEELSTLLKYPCAGSIHKKQEIQGIYNSTFYQKYLVSELIHEEKCNFDFNLLIIKICTRRVTCRCHWVYAHIKSDDSVIPLFITCTKYSVTVLNVCVKEVSLILQERSPVFGLISYIVFESDSNETETVIEERTSLDPS